MRLTGKVSLVTGASRGIGAATALKLAEMGSDVVLNYRSKGPRAEALAEQIAALGRVGFPIQADLTVETELTAMMDAIRERFNRLDALILNASGGLERGKAEDYATALNHTAQLQTAQLAAEMMPPGSRIVFVTSHWAHFYGQKDSTPGYEVVARTKYAGERALLEHIPQFSARGISLVIVSGDVIEGTITPRLLQRRNSGRLGSHVERELPTVEQFAEVIAQSAADPNLLSGQTVFVGSTEH